MGSHTNVISNYLYKAIIGQVSRLTYITIKLFSSLLSSSLLPPAQYALLLYPITCLRLRSSRR